MRKKYSPQKIGLVLFLTVGISLGLYYGLDNPNVLSYAVPLDVSRISQSAGLTTTAVAE